MSNRIREVAIGGIVILEAIALYMGVNGTILSLCIGAIAGIAGYTIAKIKK